MSKKNDELIAKAKKGIEKRGWTVVEDMHNDQGDIHILLKKDGERKGWGMFDRVYCWTEAFEHVTGKRWMDLLDS